MRLVDDPEHGQNPFSEPSQVDIGEDGEGGSSIENGVEKTENADGSATFDFNPDKAKGTDKGGFYENLAGKLGDAELQKIASDLLAGIDLDEQSRKDWLDMRAKGITLLGLKINDPKNDVGTSGAPLEGMSSIRHPLLLEATIRFQATARGELLPASGPVKVRNDSTVPPSMKSPPVPGMGHNGGPPLNASAPPPMQPPQGGPGLVPTGPVASPAGAPFAPHPPGAPMPPPGAPPGLNGAAPQPPPPAPEAPPAPPEPHLPDQGEDMEELAQALEKDFNHYLTVDAPEYIPDTDRMLFYVGFGGDGFKKVYNCPLRRRPVSESVDAENLIVSNSATDLQNCPRVTHKISMRRSLLRRMQIVGAYRDVSLALPSASEPVNPVDQAKNAIQGTTSQATIQRPEDRDYTVLECYCELDLDEFAPTQFKGKALPLPYKVTLEKESRQVLEIRRNWEEKDEQCLAKRFFVQFPYIRGLGFYGLGLVHVLGNTTITLTAAWREMLDAGMYASFPGFIYNAPAGRQLTNQFRCPPGGGIPIQGNGQSRIQDQVMPLPYKEPGPAFTAFITHVEEVGQRLGGTAQIQVGEGKQDAPVGTTMALIEQATKQEDAVHKRLHAAQAEEFQLLKARFQEDPEAFWRHNKKPTRKWKQEQFLRALEHTDLVPVADPNNPTSLHRIMKATTIKTLQQANPAIYDAIAVDQRIMKTVGIDPEGLFRQGGPAPEAPDPRLIAIQAKQQAEQLKGQIAMGELQLKWQESQREAQDETAARESRERIEQIKVYLETLREKREMIIHAHDLQADQIRLHHEVASSQVQNANEIQMNRAKHQSDMQREHDKHQLALHTQSQAHEQTLSQNAAAHEQRMEQQRQQRATQGSSA